MSSELWPDLTIAGWDDTRDTVQMWTQIVGKVRLVLEGDPHLNHWWGVTLYVSARGLTTGLMHTDDLGLDIEFDFIDHVLHLRTTDNRLRSVALEPRTVASFYEATMTALEDLGVRVRILARPVEIPEAIPFAEDVRHSAYDPDAMHRYWRALVQVDRVLRAFRARFGDTASVSPSEHPARYGRRVGAVECDIRSLLHSHFHRVWSSLSEVSAQDLAVVGDGDRRSANGSLALH